MPKSATPIFLSDDDKSYLKSVLQKGTVEARVHRRAKILLLKSDGMADETLPEKIQGIRRENCVGRQQRPWPQD